MDENKKPSPGANRDTGRGLAFHDADLTANLKHFRNAIILSGFIDGAVLALVLAWLVVTIGRVLA